MRTRLLSPLIAAAIAGLFFSAGPTELAAQNSAYLQTDRLGYTGTVETYNSFLGALIGKHPADVFEVPQRDLATFMVDNNPAFSGLIFPPSAFYFLTYYYANGGATPSNTNVGFVQITDNDAGSVTSADGKWMNEERTEFLYEAKGFFTYPGCPEYTPDQRADCPALWNAGGASGAVDFGTEGLFLGYEFSLSASGLSPAVWNPAYGVYESTSEPKAIYGSFKGLFVNTDQDDPTANGFYRVDLDLDMTSYAYKQGWVLPSVFGSAKVVPEPSAYLLMATGLLGLVGASAARRRRSN